MHRTWTGTHGPHGESDETDAPADRTEVVPGWRATWIDGPAAGRSVALGPGSHWVGRSTRAHVHTADPALSAFEGELEVTPLGHVRFTQTAGRAACAPAPWAAVGESGIQLDRAEEVGVLDLGSSRLELRRSSVPGEGAERRVAAFDGSPSDGMVRRAPRAASTWAPVPIEVPLAVEHPRVAFAGLVPAVLGSAGALAVAVVMDQPMFLLLGLVGGVVAIAGWLAQQWSVVRRRRSGRSASRAGLDAFVVSLDAQRREHARHHRVFVGTLADAVRDVTELRAGLWSRRPGMPDVHTVSAGRGDVRWEPQLTAHATIPTACWTTLERAAIHHDASIPVELGPGARVAVCGDGAMAVVRALVLQLAAHVGPADWQLLIVSDTPGRWSWAADLPHLVERPSGDEGPRHVLDGAAAVELCRDPARLEGRHTLVVTDAWTTLSVRTSPVRRLASSPLQPAVLAICPSMLDVPAFAGAVLEVSRDARGRWLPDAAAGHLPQPIRCAGLAESDARALTAQLARLVDPEDPRHAAGAVPRSVSLLALLWGDEAVPMAATIVEQWSAASSDPALATPIGAAGDGVVELDLARDGPHALLAGTTGAGKSELLRALVIGLAARCSPEHVTFVLVDYKGGATFDCCLPLPHVVGVVTDLDDHLAERALRSLRAELHRRERILRAAGASDLAALRRSAGRPELPRLLVVIDEFAALAVEQPGFLHALVGIAQRGRSLGVHLLLATQRPSGVVSDDIRANTNLRIALRLQDVTDAMDVVGDPVAAALPRDVPGRAVMRLGPGELVEFQTAHVGGRRDDGRTEADVLVAAISAAAVELAISPPHRPWLPQLPDVLDGAALPDGLAADPTVLGLVDLPDAQEQRPLRWHLRSGNLIVVGARGAGVSTTLRSATRSAIAAAALSPHRTSAQPPCVEVYVVDALGDAAWDEVAPEPWCGGVVRLHERERLLRLLTRLGDPVQTAGVASPSDASIEARDTATLLVVDGLAALRSELDAPERSGEADAWQRIVAGTGRARVTLAVGATDALSLPASLLARCPHRWLLHVNDTHDATILGLPPGSTPPDVPGRAIVQPAGADIADAAEAQLLCPRARRDDGIESTDLVRTPRLDVLPAFVDATELPIAALRADEWHCPLGTSFASLTADGLTIPDGEHLLILGPARSGRSTVLARLLHGWLQTALLHGGSAHRRSTDHHGATWAGVLAPRRSALRDHADAVRDERVCVAFDVRELLDAIPPAGPALVLIDDAELVDDPEGRLAALITSRRPRLVVAAAARPEALRAAYGHWTAAVRRSRRGVLMAACHDTDGDLLGAALPRRVPIAARIGLAHVVEDGTARLVQCALDALPAGTSDLSARRAAGPSRPSGTSSPGALTAVS